MATDAQPVLQRHIEIRSSRAGQTRAFIAGTRIRVQDIYVQSELRRNTPDDIVAAYPHLTLGQVHAALAYYFDNREVILEETRQDKQFAAEMEAKRWHISSTTRS